DAVGPGGPFGGGARLEAEDARAGAAGGDGVAERLGAGGDDRGAGGGGDGDGGGVGGADDHQLGDLGPGHDRGEGGLRHLPGQLVLVGEVLLGAVDADVVVDHAVASWWAGSADAASAVESVGMPAPCRWARARRRWTRVLAAASSGSPEAIARAMSACS